MTMSMVAVALGSILSLLAASSAAGGAARGHEADQSVEYTVGLMDARTQTVHMTMRLTGVNGAANGDALDICLPVWRPGRYTVLEPASSIRWLSASTADGTPLVCEKTDKATWRIQTLGAAEVRVDYVLYANSIGDRTRHVDESHAFLSPATVFVYAPEFRALPANVKLELPVGWSVSCGLPSIKGDPTMLYAVDYDRLVDSPIEAGIHDVFTFEVEDTPHEIVVWWGDGPGGERKAQAGKMYTSERLTTDFAKIVAEQKKLFGDLPYDRYVFMIHVYPGGGGGTEHWNSTIMQCTPTVFQSEDSYRRFLGLVSHEFFHTWNVKRLRPAGLRPYDYQHENYTDLLWIAEGTTSYYQGVMLVRAGLSTPDSELDGLTAGINGPRDRPGTGVQSVEESSFDSWIKFNRPSPDDVNSRVSFYDRGSMASFLLDLEVRERSAGAASLDDLMRDLYERFPETGRGYTRRDVIDSANRLARSDFTEFFDRYISGLQPYPFASKVGVLGLELVDAKKGKREDAAYAGINFDSSDPPTVSAVLSDGPAYAAGLIAGDTVMAANGLRLRSGVWDKLLKSLAPGDQVKLTVFRYDALREIEFALGSKSSERPKLRRVSEPTQAQRSAYQNWLGQPWPAAVPAQDDSRAILAPGDIGEH